MHVVLICTSVIIQLHSVLSTSNITDITNDCLGHRTTPFFLTSGIGSYDSRVLMIATEQKINCTLEFVIMNLDYILAVVEFPDWYSIPKICIQEKTSAVTVSDFKETKICKVKKSVPRHSVLYKKEMKINFEDLKTIHTMKIIATSMRDPGLYKCNPDHEVECVFRNNKYCMNKIFKCDKNPNCGDPESYDEDTKMCAGLGVTPFMIFCSIIMHVLSLSLLVLLSLSFLPKRKETFVYKFDNSLPLFDSENEILNYDIDIKILFPKDTKLSLSSKSVLIKK